MTREFKKKPSTKYLQAVDALRDLLNESDLDMVKRAYAEAVSESKLREYIHGIKAPHDSHVCVSRLKVQAAEAAGDCSNAPTTLATEATSQAWMCSRPSWPENRGAMPRARARPRRARRRSIVLEQPFCPPDARCSAGDGCDPGHAMCLSVYGLQ